MIATTRPSYVDESSRSRSRRTARLGLVVAASLASGAAVAVGLIALAPVPPEENVLSGVVLLSFALGWALLAVLSYRFTDRPQRWAIAPAGFMAVAGLASLSGNTAVLQVLGWAWPPVLLALVVWMFLRVRRQARSRSARWLLYVVLVAFTLAGVGGGYETVREALDARTYPAPGRLVDVDGHRLHLHCTGAGSPTVVLEPGLGGSSAGLGWIEPAVARDSRVCVYDRAGRGWSDSSDGPQDAAHVAADLHTLLDRAGVPGPYVLAGHSFGGLYVLSFAAQFPDQVAGLVLLDSTAPKPGPEPTAGTTPDPVGARVSALVPAIAHLGAGRLLGWYSFASLPPRARDEAAAHASTARHLASFIAELRAGAASTRQAAALTSLGDKPLIVLTADTGHDDSWRSAQDQLATLSTNSLHRVATATTHASMVDEEADSAAASQAIRDVVTSVRTARPLPAR